MNCCPNKLYQHPSTMILSLKCLISITLSQKTSIDIALNQKSTITTDCTTLILKIPRQLDIRREMLFRSTGISKEFQLENFIVFVGINRVFSTVGETKHWGLDMFLFPQRYHIFKLGIYRASSTSKNNKKSTLCRCS